jgi:aryl-alcohol dehydrogenase-like predicted oxidoreductase
MNRLPERDLLSFAEAHGHIIIAFSPLAQEMLSGIYHGTDLPADSIRTASPMFRPENLEHTADLIAALREVADAHSATPAQIALVWAIHHPAVAAIPAAAEIELADDEYQALDKASARFCPATVPDAPDRLSLSALEHSARSGWSVAKTVWHDRYRQ